MRSLEWFKRGGEADSIDRAVDAFEARIGSGRPSLAEFWGGLGSKKTPSILAALVKVDLRRRFGRGERPRVLEYLDAFPILGEDGDRVISLVYEEFCLLEEGGDAPDSGAFCDDYGPWRDSLASQLAYHRELSRAVGAESPSVNFPDPGERFGKYHLDSILGVGGVARVYLATEDELGGRQVAIKVSASFGQEPSILGKLDHRNIVPILTVAESDSGLRGICMPYRPGLTLEEMIRRIGRGTPPRGARAISDALRPRDCPTACHPEEQRAGWGDFPIDRTFPEAVAWIGLALSQALSYLHKKGIYHRDIKPANILLAYGEGPQLLDFNLAQVPNNPEGATAAQKGGTLPYMAPEQLKAFLDPSAWQDVEETADIYSLGLVLRELLTGRAPELPKAQGSLAREIQELIDRRNVPRESIREINPGVPPALDSIIDKCLATLPADRYAGARELAADLQRFIQRKPLLNAPNPSKVELGINWIYRHRHGVVGAVLCSGILFSILGSFLKSEQWHAGCLEAESLLDSGKMANILKAREIFIKLHREYPNTARPPLGLAMTLSKLNQLDPDRSQDAERIRSLFQEATKKSDSEAVIRERRAKHPDSPALLLCLGLVLSERSGEASEARKCLESCLEKEPDAITAIVALSILDQKSGEFEGAHRELARAIKLGLEQHVDEQTVYGFRRALLHNLVKLIDTRLDGWIASDAWAEADAYRGHLETNLASFKSEDGQGTNGGADGNAHDFWVEYYEGCLLSIRGVLDSEGGDNLESNRRFDEASTRFERARAMAYQLESRRDRLQLVTRQIENLDRRRTLWVPRG